MTLTTTNTLIDWYRVYNEKYFDNQLPNVGDVIFEFSRRKNAWGDCTYPHPKTNYKYRIRLSTYCDREEKAYKQTLIHEMIHVYCHLRFKERGHGIHFKLMCQKINRDGWNLKRTTNSTITDTISENQIANLKQRSVFVFTHSDYPNKICVGIATMSKFYYFENFIKNHSKLTLLKSSIMKSVHFERMTLSKTRINYTIYGKGVFNVLFPTLAV